MARTKKSLKDDVQAANNSSWLLDNPEYKAACETVEKQYLEFALAADITDDLSIRRANEAIRVVRLVTRQLAIAVQNGKL